MPQPIQQIGYSIDRDAGTVHRHTQTIGFWGLGLVQSQRVLLQSSDTPQFALECAHSLVEDIQRTHPSDLGQFPSEIAAFETRLAKAIGSGLKQHRSIDVSWEQCVRRLERGIPGLPVTLTHLLANIRRFENQLSEAAAELPDGPRDPTRHWNIESIILVTLSSRRYDPARLSRFAYDLMDLKYKLFCLARVDLPIYASHVRVVGRQTAAARLVALSFDSLLAFKLRAALESVMNLTYHLETGHDAEQDWGKNKSRHWWKWIRQQPRWRGLAQFRRAVSRYEELVRTPEAHTSSRMRSLFAANRSPKRHRALANELTNFALGIWDHLTVVIGLGQGVTYHRGRQRVESPRQ